MAAPKGNKFYMNRGSDGRELIFKTSEELLEKAYKYFNWCEENPWIKNEAIKSGIGAGQIVGIPTSRPYTIVGFCVYCGISEDTFALYSKRNDFIGVVTHIREVIRQNQLEGACVGAYSPNIVARLLGLADKQELTGADGQGLVINVTSPKAKKQLEELKAKLS